MPAFAIVSAVTVCPEQGNLLRPSSDVGPGGVLEKEAGQDMAVKSVGRHEQRRKRQRIGIKIHRVDVVFALNAVGHQQLLTRLVRSGAMAPQPEMGRADGADEDGVPEAKVGEEQLEHIRLTADFIAGNGIGKGSGGAIGLVKAPAIVAHGCGERRHLVLRRQAAFSRHQQGPPAGLDLRADRDCADLAPGIADNSDIRVMRRDGQLVEIAGGLGNGRRRVAGCGRDLRQQRCPRPVTAGIDHRVNVFLDTIGKDNAVFLEMVYVAQDRSASGLHGSVHAVRFGPVQRAKTPQFPLLWVVEHQDAPELPEDGGANTVARHQREEGRRGRAHQDHGKAVKHRPVMG